MVTAYGYNALYELTSVNRDGKITDYAYDPDGNRVSMTAPGTSSTYIYDADDRLLIGGESSFTYDADGNETSKTLTADGQPIVYSYDAANRLVSATGPNGGSTFAYDGDGNRIAQRVETGTYHYVNDVATALPVALQESGPDGNISYAYGLGRISESSSAWDYFYQYDGLGSTVGLTDSNAKLAGRYVYDAWGNLNLSIPDTQIGTENKFQFTGEALDPGTGLYYLRARYYDPGLGRLISGDPLIGIDRLPLSQNGYAYAFSSPQMYSDPTGESVQPLAFQSFLGGSPLNLQNADSTTAECVVCSSDPSNFDLITGIVEVGGKIYEAGSSNPPLDAISVTLNLINRVANGENPLQALAQTAGSYDITYALLKLPGGAYLATAYTATKLGASIGSIPAVETSVSEGEFWVLNTLFGPTQVQQWSTSPAWTFWSGIGSDLAKLP